MNKRKYLKELRKRLRRLPEREIEDAVQYYAEFIDDALDEGREWSHILSQIGNPGQAASKILRGEAGAELNRDKRSGYYADAYANRNGQQPPVYNNPNYQDGYNGNQGYQGGHNGNVNYNGNYNAGYNAPHRGSPPPQPQAEARPQKRSGRKKFFLYFWFIAIPLSIAAFILALALMIAVVCLTVTGFALCISAPVVLVYAVVAGVYTLSPMVGFSYAAAAFACFGAGMLIIWLSFKLYKPVRGIFRLVFGRKKG